MALRRHSLRLNGHETSVSIEDEFWEELRRIAQARGQSLAALAAEIDHARMAAADPPNLSSALRLFVLAALKAGD